MPCETEPVTHAVETTAGRTDRAGDAHVVVEAEPRPTTVDGTAARGDDTASGATGSVTVSYRVDDGASLALRGAARRSARRTTRRASRHGVGPAARTDRYRTTLALIDVAAASVAVVLACLLRFSQHVESANPLNFLFAVLFPAAWVVAVHANGGYERRFVGVGTTEYDRVLRAFFHLTVAVVFVLYFVDVPVARGFVVPALGLALGFDLLGRFVARKRLHHRRRQGLALTPVVAVGGASSLPQFADLLRRDQYAGLEVVGVCLPDQATTDPTLEHVLAVRGIPVLGSVDSIGDVVRDSGARAVAVLSGDVGPDTLRWISWQLETVDCDLVVSPGLADFGGGRLHIQPVAGLPLLHVEKPAFTGFARLVKAAIDRTVAALGLLVLAPLLLGVAVLVRLTSRGPAFFLQRRVGQDGREFRMVKFRSMVVDAEQRRAELLTANESDGVLFKIKDDPRVTPVGRVLRRFSIDELPQLVNVFTGSMSLVGPRPPLPHEVAAYGDATRRRLLVKPGITGLWQVSGRSDLSWDESVRLDLRYVEDWSLALDLSVLWKTARAVVKAEGAY